VSRYWRWGPWVVLVALAVSLLAIGSHRSSHPTLDAQVMHIANEVRCPVCDGETAAQSSAPASVQIRSQIRQELLAGEPSDQILAGLVRDYGSGILEKPQSSGVGLVVWVVPVVATVLAAAALAWAFIRWRRRAQPSGKLDDGAMAGSNGGLTAGANGSPVPPSGSIEAPAPLSVRSPASAAQPPALVSAQPPASLDEALAAVVAPATAVASVQSSGSSGLSGLPSRSVTPTADAQDPDVGPSPALNGAGPVAPGDPGHPARKRQQWLRGILIGVGVCLIAGGAGWAVAESSKTRLPGQTITGQALGSETIAQDMQTAQADAAKGNAVAAIEEYQKILQTDPNQVDALTGEGWLLVQTAEPSLLQQGIQLLGQAEQADQSYAPAHLYRGLALLGEADYADAVPEFQWYLGHQPDPSIAPEVRQDLQQAQAAAAKAGSSAAGKS
jgi:cytochrome c-type biogenesis protein CcmH